MAMGIMAMETTETETMETETMATTAIIEIEHHFLMQKKILE